MATVVLTTPCGVPIPIHVPLPELPPLPALPDIPPLFGLWLPMWEPPTICPLLLDAAKSAAPRPPATP